MERILNIEELSKRDTRLGRVLDSLFDGVYIVDRKRRIIFWNRGAEKITGYRPEEVTGRRCADNILNHIDAKGNLLCKSACPLLYTLRTGQEAEEKVYPLHREGHRFPTLTHVAPIKNDKGEIIAGIEIFRDISVEENFRNLQEKFSAFIRKYVSAATFDIAMAQANDSPSASRTRDLTVLFLDVAGFTTYSETKSPEEIVTMLNELFGITEVITRECHGDIDKYIGDSVMAVFIDANDAVRAAARILYDALPEMNALRLQEDKEAINIRIGINSGDVVQGDIGSPERKDLTVIGDTVNVASRIQSVAPVGSIAISEATYARLDAGNAARCAFIKKFSLKGKKNPIPIFQYISPLLQP